MLQADDVVRVCHEVMTLGKIADLRFKALPVLLWEFADRGEFYRAQHALLQALAPLLMQQMNGFGVRDQRSGVWEFDCYGVTFRLVYKGL